MGRKSIRDYDEKLLVVVNPWPPSGPTHPQFVNNVASWFEVMLGKESATKVDAIYRQRTHLHIIVELPAEANTDQLVGAHHWGDFLAEPWKSKYQEKVSYVYEYNYQVFRHPSQINWYAAVPTYSAIDPAFPIRSPYPSPRPAPSATLPYAAALPPQLRLVNNPPPQEQNINNSTSEPVTNPGKLSKKDPYDQEEEAMRVLQSSIPKKADSPYTNEENPVGIKAELDYEPSPELVSLLSQYRVNDTIKTKQEEIYHPSIELKAAITDHIVRIKQGDDVKNFLLENESTQSPKRRNNDDDHPTKRIKKEYP